MCKTNLNGIRYERAKNFDFYFYLICLQIQRRLRGTSLGYFRLDVEAFCKYFKLKIINADEYRINLLNYR